MHRIALHHHLGFALAGALLGWALLPGAAAQVEPPAEVLETAAAIVEFSGAPGGLGTVVGSSDAELPLAIARRGGFTVQCLAADAASRDRLRQAIRAAGLYGNVSADVLPANRLPYAENLLNIVVVDSYSKLAAEGLSPEEVLRVLAPLGVAYLGEASPAGEDGWMAPLIDRLRAAGVEEVAEVETPGRWVRLRKPWPDDIDEWSHYLHGPDGNPVADDRVVGPPAHYQWIAGPRWMRSHESDSSLRTLVTSGGRLFAIVNEAPISLAGDHDLPDQWFLVARDAFNGVLLWKVPIRRWGWREWKPTWFTARPGDFPLNIEKRLVATGDRVYVTLGYHAPVSQLDARTGELLQTYPGTERTGEILYVDGALVLSVLTDDGLRVVAVDAASGERKWVSANRYGGSTVDYIRWATRHGAFPKAELDPSLNTATDGRVVALIDGPDIVALDFRSGDEQWRAPFPQAEADRTAGGIQSRGNLWIGTMIVRDGVVVHAGPHKLAALDAGTGKLLWEQPTRYIGHLWYNWKDVFVIDGLVWTWTADLVDGTFKIGGGRTQRTRYPPSVNGYDLRTGELKREVPLGLIFKTHHHHRCYRNKATPRYILASRRGSEFVDLEEGKHTVHNWVRGTCHVGMMPANGLQYAPPHPCVCYIEEKLDGFYAVAPAKPEPHRPPEAAVPVLQRGPAFGRLSATEAGPDDWPTFRADAMRTGSSIAPMPDDTAVLWQTPLGRRLSPPIAVDGRVFLSLIDEHHVVCLDARNGSKQWEFAAGARVDSPPTWYRGTVIFGSADGWVYCLRAEDGALAWRFRAAPEQRQIAVDDQLESAWPVHGSVLVQNGTTYFAAGRTSQLDGGMVLYGLDAATGELRHRTTLEGPHYTVDNIDEANFRLPMGALPDVLMGDGTKIYMRNRTFDAELNSAAGTPALRTVSGFLDDSYFKRAPWRFGDGQSYGRLLVHDDRRVFVVRMFDSLEGLNPRVYFTPGEQGYLLFARGIGPGADRAVRRGEAEGAWSQRIPVRVRAMALTADRLLVAGPPDVVDPKDPLGAFQGRKGGLLYVIDAASGERLAEHTLPSPPVFNGAAVAGGRLFLAGEDGSLACFAVTVHKGLSRFSRHEGRSAQSAACRGRENGTVPFAYSGENSPRRRPVIGYASPNRP